MIDNMTAYRIEPIRNRLIVGRAIEEKIQDFKVRGAEGFDSIKRGSGYTGWTALTQPNEQMSTEWGIHVVSPTRGADEFAKTYRGVNDQVACAILNFILNPGSGQRDRISIPGSFIVKASESRKLPDGYMFTPWGRVVEMVEGLQELKDIVAQRKQSDASLREEVSSRLQNDQGIDLVELLEWEHLRDSLAYDANGELVLIETKLVYRALASLLSGAGLRKLEKKVKAAEEDTTVNLRTNFMLDQSLNVYADYMQLKNKN